MSQKENIALCLPLYANLPVDCFINFNQFYNKLKENYNIVVLFSLYESISNARDLLVKEFLKTKASYLFFLDYDMLLPSATIEKLLSHKKDFVSALCFTKSGKPVVKKFVSGKYEFYENFPQNQLFEVDATGLAATLISRKLIEKLSANDDLLFKCKFLDSEKVLGEDVYFCELAKKNGFKLYVDSSVRVGHYGSSIKLHSDSSIKPGHDNSQTSQEGAK